MAGGIYDDGMWLEDYTYNRLQLSWTEFIPVPITEHHTFQLDFDLGYIDRNVMGWDELWQVDVIPTTGEMEQLATTFNFLVLRDFPIR